MRRWLDLNLQGGGPNNGCSCECTKRKINGKVLLISIFLHMFLRRGKKLEHMWMRWRISFSMHFFYYYARKNVKKNSLYFSEIYKLYEAHKSISTSLMRLCIIACIEPTSWIFCVWCTQQAPPCVNLNLFGENIVFVSLLNINPFLQAVSMVAFIAGMNPFPYLSY